MLGPYHRGLMARVARVFHEATFRGGGGGGAGSVLEGDGGLYLGVYMRREYLDL